MRSSRLRGMAGPEACDHGGRCAWWCSGRCTARAPVAGVCCPIVYARVWVRELRQTRRRRSQRADATRETSQRREEWCDCTRAPLEPNPKVKKVHTRIGAHTASEERASRAALVRDAQSSDVTEWARGVASSRVCIEVGGFDLSKSKLCDGKTSSTCTPRGASGTRPLSRHSTTTMPSSAQPLLHSTDTEIYQSRSSLHAATSAGKFCNVIGRTIKAKVLAPRITCATRFEDCLPHHHASGSPFGAWTHVCCSLCSQSAWLHSAHT